MLSAHQCSLRMGAIKNTTHWKNNKHKKRMWSYLRLTYTFHTTWIKEWYLWVLREIVPCTLICICIPPFFSSPSKYRKYVVVFKLPFVLKYHKIMLSTLRAFNFFLMLIIITNFCCTSTPKKILFKMWISEIITFLNF